MPPDSKNALILAIDQGTTSSRALLFSSSGDVRAVWQKELPQIYPQKGWVEHDPRVIWADTLAACRAIIKDAGSDDKNIAAIGITNQRETTIIWDRKTGVPVYNAIVWQDRRTALRCADLKAAGKEHVVAERTGLLLDPYFSATKIEWILDNVPGARKRAEDGDLAFGTVDCWLLWNLTGGAVHATDATNASRTMLYNIRTQQWDDDLLNLFRVPAALLPEVKDNAAFFGTAVKNLLGGDIPVTGMAGDQQAALVGQACFAPGMIKSTYGTGCFALMNTGAECRASRHRLLTTPAYRLDGKICYALEGSIFVAGAAIQWLRDGLGIIKSAAETETLARSVPDSNGVYFVPAFAGLGAPHWNPGARGVISGLTRDTKAAHIVRAALEAQAFQTRDLMDAMKADGGIGSDTVIRADGGLIANEFVCQQIADITGMAVEVPAVAETTALGAAYLAGLQAGIYGGLDDISAKWRHARHYAPALPRAEADAAYRGWIKATAKAA